MREVYFNLLDSKYPNSKLNSIQETETETPMVSVQETRETQESPQRKDMKSSEESEDHSSPRGVLEIPVLGTDSDNSSSTSSYSSSSSSSSSGEKLNREKALVPECQRLQWRKLIDTIKKKSLRRFSTFSFLTTSDISKRSLNRKLARIQNNEDHGIEVEMPLMSKPSWRSFGLEELAAATDNFSSANLIGKGGHAEVYKGCLSDGQLVAVKRLTRKKTEEERTADFLSELGIIAHIDHPNAAHLLGFGVEGGLHLVLQYSPHGSLASLLHGTEGSLDWGVRFKVAVGVAEGLNYLHQGCQRRIIHRDIKASNVLLTNDYEPQISDFGLAKWLPDQWAHHIVFPIEGTFGYMAPEYFMHGIIDEKTDVFAFGVLLLELITGRRAVDSSLLSLVLWAKPLLETNDVKGLIDPRLGDAYDAVELKNMTSTASMCIHHLSTRRPQMSRVVQLLKGENVGREQKPHIGRALLLDACDLEDYTCSTYLNDLNRHMQLALE